ncbi:putative ABC transport system permease protein [Lentzea fradiae]|uniref:Putative ABC transport system permease protein n=1 Tax=Lentzea fradiae TaxID=200378 RepID=A0A1G7VA61_9PSEU|nr:FtsX-like permease family protein [Lentzea fradiae]SDG56617.1 putative ABC transport system permease protein [Lentzea fradiae]
MLTLAWQTVKARTSGFVGAFVAILCGTALVAACGILMESGFRGGVPTQRYAATDLVVTGDRLVRPPGADELTFENASEQVPVPASLAGKIAAVPGVREAVPEQTFPALVVGPDGQPLADKPTFGHNWESAVLAPYAVKEGAEPRADDEVVLDAGLAARAGARVGDEVRVMTRTVPATYRVAGIAEAGGDRQAALFFTSAEAANLAGRTDQLSAVGVLAEPGAQDLAARVAEALRDDHVTVAQGADRSAAEFEDVGRTKSMLAILAGSFGGYAVMISIFVVASTLALAVEQRRREFALLRAVGATPKQVRRLIGVETTVVSLVAGVLGSLLGIAVSRGLRDAFAAIGVLPADFALSTGPIPLVAALGIGVGAARLAAWSAARRPSSINPVEALGEAAVQKRDAGTGRLVTGWALVALGLGTTAVPFFLRGELGAAMPVLAALVLVVGLALVGPRVIGGAVRLIAPVLGRAGLSGYLAAANAVKNSRRLAAAVTPLMLAIGFFVVHFYSQTTFGAAVQQQITRSITADHVITGVTGVSPEVAEEARLQGATATSLVRTQVITAGVLADSVEVQSHGATGLDAAAGDAVDLGIVAGDLADLVPGTVALGVDHAKWEDKQVGDTVDLWHADGRQAQAEVVAIYRHDLAFGDYVLPAADARAHLTSGLDTAVLVKSGDEAALRDLTSRYPGLAVTDGVTAQDGGEGRTQFLLNLIAIGVILGYVAISVSNTLVMSTAARRREFALLRLVGTGRRQVTGMMRAEALLTVALAAVLGTAVAAVPLVTLSLSTTGSLLPTGPIWVYPGALTAAAVLGLASIAISTRLSLRGKPIDTIGIRE